MNIYFIVSKYRTDFIKMSLHPIPRRQRSLILDHISMAYTELFPNDLAWLKNSKQCIASNNKYLVNIFYWNCYYIKQTCVFTRLPSFPWEFIFVCVCVFRNIEQYNVLDAFVFEYSSYLNGIKTYVMFALNTLQQYKIV
jgi:hypothetical protein